MKGRRHYSGVLAVWLIVVSAGLGSVRAETLERNPAATLLTRYAELRDQLTSNAFQQPLYLDSAERKDSLRGDVYGVVAYPLASLVAELREGAQWCEVLILHLNIKYCRPSTPANALTVYAGRKFHQPLTSSYRVDYHYQVKAQADDYFQVELRTDSGPFGTRDYRIVVEAIPLDAQRTFMHLTYSYGFGLSARLATQAYLETLGRDKIGFTIIKHDADGQPVYAQGTRGAIERNAIRYFLAIQSYLAAPRPDQLESRLEGWFNATERHPRQLHELEKAEYLDMKRLEYQRQSATP